MGREVIRKKRVGCQFSVRFVRGNVLLLGSSDPAMSIIGISRKYSTQEYKITSGPNIENDFLGGWWINPVNIFWFSWNLIGVQCKGYIHQVFMICVQDISSCVFCHFENRIGLNSAKPEAFYKIKICGLDWICHCYCS